MTQEVTQTVWEKLAAPLPPGVVQRRKGPGGKMLDYIDWPFIQSRLDEIVPGEWDLDVQPILPVMNEGIITPDYPEPYACVATLNILGISRKNIGTGKDWKDAATDASKRAAVRFGIGMELYEKNHPEPTAERLLTYTCVDCKTEWLRRLGTVCPNCAHDCAPIGASRPQSAPPTPPQQPRESLPHATEDGEPPSCPKCGGKMWDNRIGKKNPKAPDYKCRTRTCDGVIWPPRDGYSTRTSSTATADSVFADDVRGKLEAAGRKDDDNLPF